MRRGWLAILGMALFACDSTPKLHIASTLVATGEDVVVVFDEDLTGKATNQYWVALQPASAPASDRTGRTMLERTDRTVHLRTSAPGNFEVRLHGRYPKKEHHLIARIPVKVEGWPVRAESPSSPK